MITKEEIKELEGNYFEVLQTGAFAITLKSKNTGHYWHLLEREYPTFRHFAITISIMMLMRIMPKGRLVIWQRQYPESCHMMNFR